MHNQRSWFGHRWATLGQSGIAPPVLHQQCSRCGQRRVYDIWSRTATTPPPTHSKDNA
jgi:hypothetical protein